MTIPRGNIAHKCRNCNIEFTAATKRQYCSKACYLQFAFPVTVDTTGEMRICSKCNIPQALHCFSRQSKKRGRRLHRQCRSCRKKALCEWKLKNPDKVKIYKKYRDHWEKQFGDRRGSKRISKIYGVSQDDYDKLLKAQSGCCAICGRCPPEVKLVVDHDHYTDVVRGLLCSACNLAIGCLQDKPEIAYVAMIYLIGGQSMNRAKTLGCSFPLKLWIDDTYFESERKRLLLKEAK